MPESTYTQNLIAFMSAIRKQESSDNYRAIGPTTKYGRATGAYQFLDSTWGNYRGYTRAMDAPPAIQDERAAELMSQYHRQFGTWELVAVAWHAGPGRAQTAKVKGLDSLGGLSDGLSRTVDYARKAVTQMETNLYGENPGGGGSSSSFGADPSFSPEAARAGLDPYTGQPTDASAASGLGSAVASAAGSIARSFDDPLGAGSGGPGTVSIGGGGGASTVPLISFGDGTLDLSDVEKVESEVASKYGDLSDEEFLTDIYQDIFGRDPDPSGMEYWLGRLGTGTSRADVFRGFYASDEGGNTEPPLLSEVELMIRSRYPDWAWAMDNDEVRDILLEATDPTRGMDDATFQSKIRATEWWKTTENTVREWEARSAMDPATAQREIDKVAAELGRRAVTLGAQLDPAALQGLAEKVLRFGLTESEINDALAATFDASDPRGDVSANLRQARALANSYMVNVDESELIKWAQEVAVGTASPDDLQSRVAELARAKFGANDQMMKLIDAGGSPETYFSDHRRLVAAELDLSPDQVDLMDPKYSKILTTADGAAVRPMTLDETRSHIRNNNEFDWQSTSTGRAKIADTTQSILRAFGKVA